MTRDELVAFVENGTGLPVPGYDAPTDSWYQWFVAVNIVLGCQWADTLDEGRALGISWVRESTLDQQALAPYVDRVSTGQALSEMLA